MSPAPKPRLFLIDGNSQMYRAYHAIRDLTGPDGRSTNAVYGFVTMLRKLLAEQVRKDGTGQAFIMAAFDVAGPTFRTELAADYKANRKPMPPDLAEQVPLVHRACAALGVPVVTHAGYEADDVIGTLAEAAAARGYEVAIVTGDKDFFQLVRDGIRVFNPKDDGTWYDAGGVTEKFGVTPQQVVDVLALMGDAIDNVKGVPGIGEKGARDLIASHGSLDRLLAEAPSLPQKKYREALTTHADNARQSRELLRIRTDLPLTFDPDALRYRGPTREECFALFSALNFRSLLVEYAPTADTVAKNYRALTSLAEVEGLAGRLREGRRVALRVLTGDPVAMQAGIVGLALSDAPRQGSYIPVGHRTLGHDANLPASEVLRVLAPLLEDPTIEKVGHDLKFDVVVLARHGVTLRGLETDTMLASYLLDATRSSHGLEETALEQVAYKALTDEDICGKGAKALGLAEVPVEALLDYAGERADLPLQLAEVLRPRLADAMLEPLYRDLEMPLIPVLADLEQAGVRVDAVALAAQSQRIEAELARLAATIYETAGVEFNINSPRQLSEILFERLGLPALRRTGKTRTASTAVEVLEELALVHELPRSILEWRALQKLKGTYIDALPQLVHPDTSRVHTSFNQAVAATGRLSSSEPNLQNIPIRTEVGREIRRAFVAEPGYLLISADYSQIELRVLAHLSGDEALIEAFRANVDIHDQTALKVFGPASGLDKHELRRRAKIINYALLYGKTSFTLAKDIGVSQQAAQQFIDAYFAGFPRVRAYIDQTIAQAREQGVVRTMFGRQRLVPELRSRNGQIRAAAERVTVNMPIQGTAADILKRAMIDVHTDLSARPARPRRARMILTVHDELLFEAPHEEAEEIAALVRNRMERAVELVVPLTVDIGLGENWKDAKG